MTLPNWAELVFEQGKTFKFWFAVRYPDGEVADLAAEGYTTGRLTVRPDYDGPAVVQLTTENGGIVIEKMSDGDPVGPMDWSGYLYMSATATAQLVEWGRGVYDFEAENGNEDVIPVLAGTAILQREATY